MLPVSKYSPSKLRSRREGCEAVDVGLTVLGQTGERGCADVRLRRHILLGEAAGTGQRTAVRVSLAVGYLFTHSNLI